MALLARLWALHDVNDVEGFTARIVERSGLKLGFHDSQELHVYLIEECWLLSERFQPGGIAFSTVAGTTLRLRVVDWQRQRYGRTRWAFAGGHVHERERPQFVSLDADDSESDRLGAALSGSGVDSSEY